MPTKAEKTKQLVLCIDGGGVRGIIPALILRELEEKLKSRAKTNPIGSYFDLISGTSTGGIIALGLCSRSRTDGTTPACSTQDLVDLYRHKSKDIFGKKAIEFAGIMFKEKYRSEPLEDILAEMLGDLTSDDVLYNFLVTAYDIEGRRPKIFSNLRPDTRKPRYLLKDIARATSAAPTFFDPARIEKLHKPTEYESLMDGGIFASNPSMVTLMHMMELNWDVDNVYILSIGTGNEVRPYYYGEVKNWGNYNWVASDRAVPIVSMLLQSQTVITERYMNLVMNKNGVELSSKKYFRIDGELTKGMGSDNLDDATDQNIRELENLANKLIAKPEHQAILEFIAEIA